MHRCTSSPARAVQIAALIAIGAGGAPATAAKTPARSDRRITIIYTAEVHGAVEPCGCTSDPLGDISRFAEVVRAAKKETKQEMTKDATKDTKKDAKKDTKKDTKKDSGGVLLLDAGGLLYAEGGGSAHERAADDLRAAFLATELEKLGLAGAGLAETDLTGGVAQVKPKRLASNLPAGAAVTPASVHLIGGVKVGVLGVADPALAERLGIKSEDVVSSARRDAARLRKEGAELVVVVAPVDKALARRVAREAAVDFVIAGRQVGAGTARAEMVARRVDQADPGRDGAAAFLVAPADELQRVGRIDVVLRGEGAGALRDAGGAEAIRLRQEEIDRAVKRLDADLAKWSGAGAAGGAAAASGQNDAAFVAAKRRERDELIAERAKSGGVWAPPPQGSYFTNRLIALSRSLPRDPTLVAAMKRLDARIAAVNLKNAAPPPPPEPGRAFYVGVGKCVQCHRPAVQFWKKTVHAGAWKTLVDGGKQADYKCVGCHLTGYGQVGGSALGFAKGLQSVQCENCHGPGSTHVAEKGLEEPSAVHREAPETTCLPCHNEHHSDTFQYQAYLRDIVGPGHGGAARKKLGDGPTGHTLRTAALAKARRAGASQLEKM
jgi:hypothetical protein